MDEVAGRIPTVDPVVQRFDRLAIAVKQGFDTDAFVGAAVFLDDDDVLADIDQTSSQIAGFGRFEGGVGGSFAGAMGGNEEFAHRESFTEVGFDW